jgi:hypothetical protein
VRLWNVVLILFTSFIFSLIPIKSNSQTIDRIQAYLIERIANQYFSNDWQISLSQYQAWIGLISLREAGSGRASAHSGWAGDQFYHKVKGEDFPFCMGVGPFQLHRGGEAGGENENWDAWPIIDKVNPEKSLLSVLRWHRNRWRTSGHTLETFSTYSPWLAVNLNYTDAFEITWNNITGTSWDTSKNTEEPVIISWPFAGDDSYERDVRYIGRAYWNLRFFDEYSNREQIWDGFYDTWHIIARNWRGKEVFRYYYTIREEEGTGWEILVYDDPAIDNRIEEFKYGFKRCYKGCPNKGKLYYPEDVTREPDDGVAGEAGFTEEHSILNPNRIQQVSNLYAATSNPGLVYRFDRKNWKLISTEEDLGNAYAVLDLIEYNGNLYAATSTEFGYWAGIGRVYKFERSDDGRIQWTLVGDNMDHSVNDLEIYNRELYAGTSRNGFRLYKYTPGTTNCGIQNWTRVVNYWWNGVRSLYNDGYNLLMGDVYWDYIGHWDGSNFYPDQPIATGSCIYDFGEYAGHLYAAAYYGRMWHSSNGINWNVILDYYDGNMWALEKFRNRLYMSYDNGELRRTDGIDLRGELVFKTEDKAKDGIISMTTDGDYLYFGTGGDAVGYGGQTTGIANVYRYDGVNSPKTIWVWDPQIDEIQRFSLAGIQRLYVSGEERLREARQNLPEWREITETIGTVSTGGSWIFQFINDVIRNLRIILNWSGSIMQLRVYRPDGSLYTEYQSDNPPIMINIPNAEIGEWKFQVVPINIPYENYPFALIVATPSIIPGDLDNDGDVDQNDLNILLSYRNKPASSCPKCDLDGDGMITVLDARKLVLLCTRPRCATE